MAEAMIVRGASELEQRLRQIASRFPLARERALYAAGEAIRSYMVANKLSGQVLRRRTGRLASGWTTQSFSDHAIVGTQVQYAAVHEFGFQGIVTVPQFWRKTRAGGLSAVRQHARRVNLPARHYAADSLKEGARDAILAAERAMQIVLGGGGRGD